MMKEDAELLHILELLFFQAFLKILNNQLTTLNTAKKKKALG